MKRCTVTALLSLLLFVTAFSQEQSSIKRFHLELGGGLAVPQGLGEPGLDGGLLFVMEPRYVISRQFKIGLKLETALLMSNFLAEGSQGSRSTSQSGYMLTADYLFPEKKVQPYAGLGIGAHTIYNDGYDPDDPLSIADAEVLAVMIRTGFEFGDNRYRAGMEYHFVGPVSFSDRNNYFSLKLGLLLFTKKRKK
jgi:hypothetical protein